MVCESDPQPETACTTTTRTMPELELGKRGISIDQISVRQQRNVVMCHPIGCDNIDNIACVIAVNRVGLIGLTTLTTLQVNHSATAVSIWSVGPIRNEPPKRSLLLALDIPGVASTMA